MSFNPTKCKVIRICKRWHHLHLTGSFYIHCRQLTTVKSGKYLRIILTLPLVESTCRLGHQQHSGISQKESIQHLCHTRAQSNQSIIRPILDTHRLSVILTLKPTSAMLLEAVHGGITSLPDRELPHKKKCTGNDCFGNSATKRHIGNRNQF